MTKTTIPSDSKQNMGQIIKFPMKFHQYMEQVADNTIHADYLLLIADHLLWNVPDSQYCWSTHCDVIHNSTLSAHEHDESSH